MWDKMFFPFSILFIMSLFPVSLEILVSHPCFRRRLVSVGKRKLNRILVLTWSTMSPSPRSSCPKMGRKVVKAIMIVFKEPVEVSRKHRTQLTAKWPPEAVRGFNMWLSWLVAWRNSWWTHLCPWNLIVPKNRDCSPAFVNENGDTHGSLNILSKQQTRPIS